MAAPAAASWATTRVFGTWRGQSGTMLGGTYKVTIPARVTNQTDDVIVPKGVYATGPLNTTPGTPSFDMQIPCNDDPDNSPAGWQPVLEITFATTGLEGEKYLLDTPVGVDVNLRTVILAATIPAAQMVLIRGVPGGLAELDSDGDVIDAAGEKVTAGGLPDDADLDDIPDSATRLAMTSSERTKLSGVATGATANSSNATLLARANHTGTQSADTLTDGTTNKAFLATERTKLSGIATSATANSSDATLLARGNHTGTQSADTLTDGTTNKAFLATERTKLTGIATSATANSADATLLARANHTGTQTASTVSDFTAAAVAAVGVSADADNALSLGTDDLHFLDGSQYQPAGTYLVAADLKYAPWVYVITAAQDESDVPGDFPITTADRFAIIMQLDV